MNPIFACCTAKVSFLLVLLATCSISAADEVEVYESLPTLTFGKVFFSQQQREALDRMRSGKAIPQTDSKPGRRSNADKAAGYITSSKGVSKVYDGESFIAVSKGNHVSFPGTVKGIRKRQQHDASRQDSRE